MRGGDPLTEWGQLDSREVFPACAGVILSTSPNVSYFLGFPRMRGGDPGARHEAEKEKRFSPHARG